MAKFDIRDWKSSLLNESFENKRMSESERKATLEAVAKFNEYGKQIYKTQEIAEMVKSIKELSENASKMVMQEQDDWFDGVSVKRDTKSIAESVKMFEGTAKEMSGLQQRLESVFEEIGQKLGKYYEINDIEEAMDAVGKEDDDIDNDGDEDSSDEYLAKKRAAISKAVKNENKFQSQVNEALNSLTEQYVVIDPRGNAKPVGSKIQAAQYTKKMGGPKRGWHIVLKKNAMKARRAIEKNGGNSTNSKIQNIMFDLRFESVDEAAPKMKTYSWEKNFNDGQKNIDIAANMMSRKSSGGYNKVKKDIMKVQKALNMLRGKMKINSTEF